MDVEDDPRTPLLGHTNQAPSSCLHRTASKFCGVESWKRRLPITIWLPKYNPDTLLRDAIAGITVGLTSIPQGIAYAIVAGLPPQVGLYSSIFPGLVYMVFGSCKDVTVGPTAILAALLAKYVAKSADFAYLASFLSGLIIVLLGVLQLVVFASKSWSEVAISIFAWLSLPPCIYMGQTITSDPVDPEALPYSLPYSLFISICLQPGFLLDFISKPVISGFTTAAALQIGASQLKTLFRVTGSSGGTFITSLINFFKNVTTVQLWDSILGIASIIMLVLLKYSNFQPTPGAPSYKLHLSRVWQYVVRARNALVVFGGALFAYILHVRGLTPFALTGKIQGGLPHFSLPPFSTVVGNQTVDFAGMLEGFGPEGLVMPLVTILESIAIAKAFAGPTPVDATQEMVAVGLCNVVCAFFTGMPAAGSFTRTALNRASGVVTQAGGIFKATLVLLSVTLLSETFYFIPRATLAAVIMVAMSGIVEFKIIGKLWRNTKSEFLVYVVTVVCGTCAGLEYGILLGAAGDAARALAAAARPDVTSARIKVGNQDCITISLPPTLSYASAEYVSRAMRRVAPPARVIVLDARALTAVDVGVAESIISVVMDLEKQQYRFLLWNFSEGLQNLFEDLHPGFRSRFVGGPSIDQHVLSLHIDRREAVMQSF